MKRRCWCCKQEKDVSNFYKDSRYNSGYAGPCRECKKVLQRRKVRNNPEAYKLKSKRARKKWAEMIIQNLLK